MSSIRKWTNKDGTVRIKRYENIKGRPASEYKREQGKKYYVKKEPKEPKEPKAPRKSPMERPTIAESLPNATLQLMKHYREAGLSVLKLSQKFGISRYTVKKALKIIQDKKNKSWKLPGRQFLDADARVDFGQKRTIIL